MGLRVELRAACVANLMGGRIERRTVCLDAMRLPDFGDATSHHARHARSQVARYCGSRYFRGKCLESGV